MIATHFTWSIIKIDPLFFSVLQSETPPQIVPYDVYDDFVESFDLSFLPTTNSDSVAAQLGIGPTNATASNGSHLLPTITTTPPASDPALYDTQSTKIVPNIVKHEQFNAWDSSSSSSSYNNYLQINVPNGSLQYGGQHSFPSPQSTTSSSSMGYENQYFPPSPTPSIDYSAGNNYQHNNNNNNYNNLSQLSFGGQSQLVTDFKQESCNLLPPSPPDSNGAPSPSLCMDSTVKMEPLDPTSSASSSADTHEDCVDIDEYFGNMMFRPIQGDGLVPNQRGSSGNDHQLLREYLQDMTFQKKHNLKPVALETLFPTGGNFFNNNNNGNHNGCSNIWDDSASGDIEPVISLALAHARRDVEETCTALNIPAGKRRSHWRCIDLQTTD